MARVVALIPDLLFGSRVYGDLVAAGHDVELLADPLRLGERLAGGCDVLVVDLTDPDLDGPGVVEEVSQKSGCCARARTRARSIGFYAHTDPATRDRALQAGFDLVVPRSRMAREGPELIRGLAEPDAERR